MYIWYIGYIYIYINNRKKKHLFELFAQNANCQFAKPTNIVKNSQNPKMFKDVFDVFNIFYELLKKKRCL